MKTILTILGCIALAWLLHLHVSIRILGIHLGVGF